MNMMTMTMKSSNGLPVGAYVGEFLGLEPTENDLGKGLKWKWKVVGGDHQGKVASRITGNQPTPKNACGKMLLALIGRTLDDGESVDLGQYVGRRYTLIVAPGQEGGTRVETIAPVPAQ